MRVFTGDLGGLLKEISVVPAEPKEPKDKKELKEPKERLVSQNHGKVNKSRGIQVMSLHEQQIVVGRADGCLEIFDINTKQFIRTMSVFSVDVNLPEKERESFVGVHGDADRVVACTSHGHLHLIKDEDHSTLSLGVKDLCVMKIHPSETHLMATGGKESDLMLWDLSKLSADSVEPMWKAKNVPHDFLDLRQPIWITDLHWRGDSPHHLVTVTEHGQVRVYDTERNRRPVGDFRVSEMPLRASCLVSHDVVAVGNTIGEVSLIDLSSGKVVRKCRGVSGCVRGLFPVANRLCVVSFDRFLRFYDVDSSELISHIYLKQRMSAVVALDESDDEIEDEDDELWEQLEEAEDVPRKKPKRI